MYCIMWFLRWIVQAMKHELKIRAGDMPPQDIYQLSPSDIKQLLLDVLQPQHTGRYSETNLAITFLHTVKGLHASFHHTDLPLKIPGYCLFIFFVLF